MSFFKIGVDLNGMSASEYLPLYQYVTNRTHIRKGRRFDQSEISQIIEKNICCGVILSDFEVYLERNISCYRIIQGRLHCGHRLMAEFCAVKRESHSTTTLQHGSRRGFQFEIPLKAYQDGLCYACDRRQISMTPRILYT